MATVAIRVDEQLKKEATALFNDLGFDMTTAVKMFLIQCVKKQGLPFEVTKETVNYEEFINLVELKSKGKTIDFTNPEDVNEFFGNEDFSEYEGGVNE